MSQGQWEQHQPVKSSPSTLIKRLFIHPYLSFASVRDSSSGATGGTTSIERARKVNSCPSPRVISHRVCERPSN
jgi:hypothetical protein